MLKDELEPLELLFRSVHQMQIKENGEPQSVTFKDKKGCSVDRQGNRTIEECAESLLKRFPNSGAILYLTVEDCLKAGAKIKYDPIQENQYHCLILNNEGQSPIKGSIIPRQLMAVSKKWQK